MKRGQEEEVVALIHAMILDYGAVFTSKVNAEALHQSSDFLNVEVADCDGEIIGICTWVPSFSTWRGIKGMYVADHFVRRSDWSEGVARRLLHLAAENGFAQGCRFIRMEVDVSDELLEGLYGRIGFINQTRHSPYFLDASEFNEFLNSWSVEVTAPTRHRTL